ncbi:MAG: asparagine synthase (glutamine-hydrolyzing) [Candidatus Aminicenantes bacterium]|nr:MAG: asparagine synthase (glutamine-hydrolyzing) [Candidatus Aminicenantes bacterium]
MSGICGIAKAENREGIPASLLSSMCQTLIHRGPDDQGSFIEKNIALGARRLSIIDLEGGHQPLANEDGSIYVVHNGEIYNFPALQTELKSRGHIFRTKSDTETIVHCYEEWGDDFVQELRGMFAFALWDRREEKLILVRDRIGIKPLYYTLHEDGTLIFASELKAILVHPKVKRALEPRALDLFLTLEYIPSPLSIFKNIHKLPAGCILIYKRGKTQIKKYWDIKQESKTSEKISKATLVSITDKLYSLLKESVQLRLISDVPLGAFLSGGIDSSSIVGLMSELRISPLRTFSIGFEETSYNELNHARRIAQKFNTLHEELILQPQVLDSTEKLIRHLDEPLGDFSIFPTYLISKMARSHVKVILSGDGGDELFGGYEHYQAQKLSEFPLPSIFQKNLPAVVKKFPPSAKKKGIWNKIRRYGQGLEYSPDHKHLRWMMFFSPGGKKGLYSKDLICELDGIKEIREVAPFQKIFHNLNCFDPISGELYLDLKTYLVDDILVKVDRMSMAASLETRAPLLDHKIVEFLFKLPGNLKLKGLTSKWIFKKTMERLLPSANILRSKEGFSIPIKNWLRQELKDMMFDYLNHKRIKAERLFNFDYIKNMMDSHLEGRENYSHQLWALLVFEIWKEQYL